MGLSEWSSAGLQFRTGHGKYQQQYCFSHPSDRYPNRYWYNEMLNYKYYMLPGILGILVTAIGFLLAGLNLVREKEAGPLNRSM